MELINQPQARRVAAIWRIYLINDIEVDVYEFAPVGPKSDDTRRQLDMVIDPGTSYRGMAQFYEYGNVGGYGGTSGYYGWYAPREQDKVYIRPSHVTCIKPLQYNDVADVQDVVH